MARPQSVKKNTPKTILRLLSLFLALIMWVSFSGRTEGPVNRLVRRFDVPLTHQGVPSMMKLTSEQYQILVTLSAAETEMKDLSAEDIDVRLDLTDYGPGTYNVPLSAENVMLPEHFKTIEVLEIVPTVVRLSLERKLRKSVKIIMNVQGQPADNFEFAGLTLNPPEAVIEGPESQLADLEFLIAEPVDISGATERMTGKVKFDFIKQVPMDTTILNLSSLTYVADIRVISETRDIEQSYPIELPKELADRVVLEPNVVNLQLSGPVSLLDWFQPEWVAPTVDLDGPPEESEVLVVRLKQQIPAQEKEKASDWQARLAGIRFEWKPAEVEAREK